MLNLKYVWKLVMKNEPLSIVMYKASTGENRILIYNNGFWGSFYKGHVDTMKNCSGTAHSFIER